MEFPNGPVFYLETFYIITQEILLSVKPGVIYVKPLEGFELCVELTNKFENKYKGKDWGIESEYLETLEAFLLEEGV